MNILFLHNNFPGQFRHLAAALAGRPGIELAAIGSETAAEMPGIRLIRYRIGRGPAPTLHPFARHFDQDCRRAEAVLRAMLALRDSGFEADRVIGHPGWGECLPVRTVFPRAHFTAYSEYFYAATGRDVGFDPMFPPLNPAQQALVELRNASMLFALAQADTVYTPTNWQRSLVPEPLRDRLHVIHDGIDTDRVRPFGDAVLTARNDLRFTARDEVVTFVARNLEPMRGYHIFMRALPIILAARPGAQVVIIGGDGVSYSPAPTDGTTWKIRFLNEVAPRLDATRVHFLGRIPYDTYLAALRISSAHVYLTYPFVPSWSLVEAMSAGCAIVASDTPPVREFIDSSNGVLTPFFDVESLAARVVDLLTDSSRGKPLRKKARADAITRYDLRQVCLPALLDFLKLSEGAFQGSGSPV